MAGEFDFIRRLKSRGVPHPRVLIGPGDDCAVLPPPPREWLVTTDVLMDGTDFHLQECGGFVAGRKAMAVNLSDIAAMAGRPFAAVVGVVLPRNNPGLADELDRGIRSVADGFNVALAGGDTNSWDGKLVISVTVFGDATGRGPVLRSGARPGDGVFVTGPVGGSLLGRHLNPQPRIHEAILMHATCDLHAMADISDGLAADLQHILEASGVGADLDPSLIPVHADAVARSYYTDRTPLDHALNDGEDFELVFTAPGTVPGAIRIGTITATPGLTLAGVPYTPTGWQHDLG
jgi:thiamine-monophosphate kinase